MSKREMSEELLLLLVKVEREDPSVTIPYVYPNYHCSCSGVPHPLRILKQLGQPLAVTKGSGAADQPQNALPTTIPSQSTPTELNPTALTTPGSLPISSLPARPNLPDNQVIPYNGFAIVEGVITRSFTCLGGEC